MSLRKNINKQLFKGKLTKDEEDNFIKENDNKNITGYVLNLKFIKKPSNNCPQLKNWDVILGMH